MKVHGEDTFTDVLLANDPSLAKAINTLRGLVRKASIEEKRRDGRKDKY